MDQPGRGPADVPFTASWQGRTVSFLPGLAGTLRVWCGLGGQLLLNSTSGDGAAHAGMSALPDFGLTSGQGSVLLTDRNCPKSHLQLARLLQHAHAPASASWDLLLETRSRYVPWLILAQPGINATEVINVTDGA